MRRRNTSDRVFPVEVLALIFHEGSQSEAGNDFLIHASHVSQYWRKSAISCPSLWWDVVISTRWSPRINFERVMAWLARSRECPIRLRSLLRGKWPTAPYEPLSPAEIDDAIKGLSTNIHRIRSFILDNRGISIPAPILQPAIRAVKACIAERGAPCFRDLSIYGSAPVLRDPLEIIGWPAEDLGHLPALQHLLLRCAPLIQLPAFRDLKRFSYKRFTLLDRESEEFQGSRRLGVKDVLEVLTSCPRITHLDVTDIADSPELEGAASRWVNTSLVHVELNFRSATALIRFLKRGSYPSVAHLSLDVDFEATDDDNRVTTIDPDTILASPLDSLTSLHLASISAPVITSILLRSPKLERLWIDDVDDWPFALPSSPIEAVIDVLVSPPPPPPPRPKPTVGSEIGANEEGEGDMVRNMSGELAPTTARDIAHLVSEAKKPEADAVSELISAEALSSMPFGQNSPATAPSPRLPCPHIKNFSIIGCEDLTVELVMRLVRAYVPRPVNICAIPPSSPSPASIDTSISGLDVLSVSIRNASHQPDSTQSSFPTHHSHPHNSNTHHIHHSPPLQHSHLDPSILSPAQHANKIGISSGDYSDLLCRVRDLDLRATKWPPEPGELAGEAPPYDYTLLPFN